MGKCPIEYYGLTDEYCVRCWHYMTKAAPDSPIALSNCTGIYDANIQIWKEGKLTTVGGTTEPVAKFGYSIWPPKECASGQCDKRSYKGLLPQESGVSLVPDTYEQRGGGGISPSCLPTFVCPKDKSFDPPEEVEECDEAEKEWRLPSMICDAATKPGDTCHPLRAYGSYTSAPDPTFEHKMRNLHAWPPHRCVLNKERECASPKGVPPSTKFSCTKQGGTWAPHVIYDRSSRTTSDQKKEPLPNACLTATYNDVETGEPMPYMQIPPVNPDEPTMNTEKKACRSKNGAYTKIPSDGTFECRMPCCLSIFEDGGPKYKERPVDAYPGGTNDLLANAEEGYDSKAIKPMYEFKGKRPVCSRANACEPKYACLGGDVCLEGYTKYYEPYVKKDGEYVCQNFHYKLPGSCPSPVLSWGAVAGFNQWDKDFIKKDVPHQHAYLIEYPKPKGTSSKGRRLSNASNTATGVEGTFDFQTDAPTMPNYRTKWCEDDETDQLCFWGTPVKVLGFALEVDDGMTTPALKKHWEPMSKAKIKKMRFEFNSTKNALLDANRVVTKLTPETPLRTVKIQMYDNKVLIVPAKDLIGIRYPAFRLSGVPDTIDPDGGNGGWCVENPARCFFERNPHPKGYYDEYGKIRPQSQVCCFAPKCTECDPSTHFRMEENCVACPKCWWCIPAIIFCVIVFGSIAFKLLSKMKFNFLIISLALDHMQILGLLAGAKIAWPYQIKFILKWFVFFQMDIDVAGPECLARGIVTFENKWIFKVTVPILAMFMCLVYVLVSESFKLMCHHAKKKHKKHKKLRRGSAGNEKIQKRKKKEAADMAANGHKEKLITFMVKAFINIVAGCYIMMTKAAMSIFSCFFPPGDDSGASFMVAQPSEPCWVDDGLQYALSLPAIIVIIAYSFGYPLSLFSLYKKNKHIIMRDQVLRAGGKGHTIKTNKDIHFRKRYGILYGYFKPTHYWWVLMFIGRKFFVCTFAVGLRNYPTFQLSAMLMVMFCCLLIQVRQRPFLDTKERAELLIDLNQKKLNYANSLVANMTVFAKAHHQDIINHEPERMRKLRKRIAGYENVIKGFRLELLNHDGYWWNLNTLEETLSTGAVILMLSGITFTTEFVANSPRVRAGIAMFMVSLLLGLILYYGMTFKHEFQGVKKVNAKLARVEWRKVKIWKNHNLKENRAHNNQKVMPKGLHVKHLAAMEAKKHAHLQDMMAKAEFDGKAGNNDIHLNAAISEEDKKKTHVHHHGGKSAMFDQIDKNHDGKITLEEMKAADKDGDGVITKDDLGDLFDSGVVEDDPAHCDTVDDLFDLFDGDPNTGGDHEDMGFDMDDLFDDAAILDGTAEKGLEFMNLSMQQDKNGGFNIDKMQKEHVHFDANVGANADIHQSNDARWDSSVHNHEVKKKKAIARSQNRLTKRETGTSLMDMDDTSSDDDDDENPLLAAVKNKPVINKPVINKPVKNDTAAILNAEIVTIDSSSDEELFPSTDEQKKDNPVESKNEPVEKKKEKLVKSNKPVKNKSVKNKPAKNDKAVEQNQDKPVESKDTPVKNKEKPAKSKDRRNTENLTIDSSSDEKLFPSIDEQKKDTPVESKNKLVEKNKEKLVKSNKPVKNEIEVEKNKSKPMQNKDKDRPVKNKEESVKSRGKSKDKSVNNPKNKNKKILKTILKKLGKAKKEQLLNIFSAADRDKSGGINREELKYLIYGLHKRANETIVDTFWNGCLTGTTCTTDQIIFDNFFSFIVLHTQTSI